MYMVKNKSNDNKRLIMKRAVPDLPYSLPRGDHFKLFLVFFVLTLIPYLYIYVYILFLDLWNGRTWLSYNSPLPPHPPI